MSSILKSKKHLTNNCGEIHNTSDGYLDNSFQKFDVPDKSGIYINTYGQ